MHLYIFSSRRSSLYTQHNPLFVYINLPFELFHIFFSLTHFHRIQFTCASLLSFLVFKIISWPYGPQLPFTLISQKQRSNYIIANSRQILSFQVLLLNTLNIIFHHWAKNVRIFNLQSSNLMKHTEKWKINPSWILTMSLNDGNQHQHDYWHTI